MNHIVTIAALVTFSTAAFAASDSFHKTLSVSDHPDLYVSTGSGNIRIHPGNGSTIDVTGHVHAGWGAFGDVQKRVQSIIDNPPIEQSGDSVKIGEVHDRSLFNNISIDYEINVPANVALNVHSGSGDVEIDNVGRFLAASSGSGNVRAHQVHGPATLESGSGDLELDLNGPGDIHARTGSGNIRVHNFDGSFNAKTGSGEIEADGHLAGASSASSGSGNVRLHLRPDSKFNLEASTGSGSLRVHMPGVTEASDGSRHHMTMSVNGGGAPLEIRTGSGDIEVTPR